jgi:hypothetical protein
MRIGNSILADEIVPIEEQGQMLGGVAKFHNPEEAALYLERLTANPDGYVETVDGNQALVFACSKTSPLYAKLEAGSTINELLVEYSVQVP